LPRKKQNTEDVRQYIQVVRKDVDKRLTDMKAEMDDVQEKAAKALKEQPLLVLGLAFLVGIAVGIAIANAGD
jgi:ElaB/YqjD/DUF883 family membrane-anchored ribosome-binding protein